MRSLSEDFIITERLTFREFFALTHPLFLPVGPAAAAGEETEAVVVSEVCFLWAVCILLQLRHEHTTAAHFLVAVTGCRGSGCSTVATALTAVCNELTTMSGLANSGLPRILVKQVPESALVLLRELMSLGMATSVVVTAELPDMGGLAFTAITRSLRSSVTDPLRQPINVVLTKVDERLSFPATKDGSVGSRESQVAELVRAAVRAVSSAAAQSCKERLAPVPVSLCPSLSSVGAALRRAQSDVPEESVAAELLRQSIERLRDLVLRDLENA